MKRFLALILILVLFAIIPLSNSAYAASNTYDLDELGLQVTIPSGYSVITRDTPASDPVFSNFNTTQSAVISVFESGNIYLDALSNTNDEEVVVTMTENDMFNDLSLLSNTTLDMFASGLVNECENYGINVSKYEIYNHAQAKYIKTYFTDTANGVHGLQYYTINDGKAINFTMRSYEGKLSYTQEYTIKTIVDSIEYDRAPQVLDPGEDTVPFAYTDTDSGVRFIVPANWKQEALSKDREFIDVRFASTKEDGCLMIYGSTDVWEKMPTTDRIGGTRAAINNSAFTKSDVAEMAGVTADKVSMVTYNGVQYFKLENTTSTEAYGMTLSVTMTQLACFDNGWMYQFQFSGTSTDELYSDFEKMLNSVQYPTVSTATGLESSNSASSKINNTVDKSVVILVLVVTMIVVAIVIAFIVSRQKTTQPANATITCPNCGQTLPLDSLFCHVCGTKITKGDDLR